MRYRPWGLLDWTLSITAPRQWFFIGALGTEDRSLVAWNWLKDLGLESGRVMVQVNPIDATRFCARTRIRLAERRRQFVTAGGIESNIESVGLLAELFQIEDLASKLSARSPSVVLDITSLPKRFFFPLLRAFAKCRGIQDLVVTYTCPREYQSDDKLSEGAGNWDYLPGFLGEEPRSETLVAAVGFMVESLQDHLSGKEAHPAVQLLIPFPATPSAVRRSWESVFNLQSTRSPDKFTKHRVDANDMSAAFDRICSLGRNDAVAFAPFGPKPISAAMCLYAEQRNSAVHYPQPDGYHPDYSLGFATVNGKPLVNAYWVKHAGDNLYTI
jgi:hypothetical protein